MEYDVVVAGGGPVGLMLACELRLGGASVVVLERAAEPYSELKAGAMGARSINAPSADALRRRGLLDEVRRAALSWHDPDPAEFEQLLELVRSGRAGEVFLGHFAGIPIRADRLDPGDEDLARDNSGGGVVSLVDLERILAERAETLGVEVLRGVEVVSFHLDPDGASVQGGDGVSAQGRDGASARRSGGVSVTGNGGVVVRGGGGVVVRGRWLVGCDGGRSLVRKAGGFEFPGIDGEFLGVQALVELAGDLPLGDWVRTETGAYVHGPVPGRIHVVEYGTQNGVDRDEPVTTDEVRTRLRRVGGPDVAIGAIRAGTRYTDATRQAATYRRGRVLLAGDAAHIHSPAGGQGLNLGLGDAVNLGWKLALVARGQAPETLLDTYTAERHPVGAWVQSWSDAQTALNRPDPRTRALRSVVTDFLMAPQAATYVLKHIAGLAQHYDLPDGQAPVGQGSVGQAPVGRAAVGQGPVGQAPVGDAEVGRAPVGRAEVGRLALGTPEHSGALLITGQADLVDAGRCWGERLTILEGTGTVFVRPDGYVAWAADGPADVSEVVVALTTWLGPAAA